MESSAALISREPTRAHRAPAVKDPGPDAGSADAPSPVPASTLPGLVSFLGSFRRIRSRGLFFDEAVGVPD